MDPEAKKHLTKGLARFAKRDYERAIKEFKEGFAISPRPELLFAWAQAERLSGDCVSALPLYRQFLDSDPEQAELRAALENIGRCTEALGAKVLVPQPAAPAGEAKPPAPLPAAAAPVQQPAPPPVAAKAPALARPPATLPASPARQLVASGALAPPPPAKVQIEKQVQPWYRDTAMEVLMAGALAGGAAGVTYTIMARSALAAADEQTDIDRYREHYADYQSKQKIALVAYGVGGAFVVGALVRYLLLPAPKSSSRVVVAPWTSADAVGLAAGGGF